MLPGRDAGDDIEIVPVVVVTRTFPARPSAVPSIREFVRQRLAQTPLSGDDVRSLSRRVADLLLEVAGTGGTIEVVLRIFPRHAEVDLLQTDSPEVASAGPALSPVTALPATAPVAVSVAAAVADAVPVNGNGNGHRIPPPRQPADTFADWLSESLRREGLTMEAAARRLNVSVKTVSRWTRGVTEPRLCDLSRMRDIFGELPFP